MRGPGIYYKFNIAVLTNTIGPRHSNTEGKPEGAKGRLQEANGRVLQEMLLSPVITQNKIISASPDVEKCAVGSGGFGASLLTVLYYHGVLLLSVDAYGENTRSG